jgi:hypothetical protein
VVDRHSRQARLADVGPEGQKRIARAPGVVAGRGLQAEVAARYLAGAGVASVRVGDEATAAAARAVDPAVRVEIDGSLGAAPALDATGIADPACRAVAGGAMQALDVLRAALGAEPS